MNRSLTIPIAIVAAGCILAATVYITISNEHAAERVRNGDPSLVRPVSSADHILGNPAAPVTIVEYSDYDCSYCKNFDETLRQIIATNGASGRVSWVFRHFPLEEKHPTALRHAEAAECAALAGGNDGFWAFDEQLFTHQPVDPSQYGTLAANAGITSDVFATCLSTASTTMDARIEADRKNAIDAGATGTPYSLILVAGQPPVVMDGAYSYDAVKQLVDTALSHVR